MADEPDDDDEVEDGSTPIDKAWNKCPGLVKNLEPHKVGSLGPRRPGVSYGSGPAAPKGVRRRDEGECDDAAAKAVRSRLIAQAASEGYADGLSGVYPQEMPVEGGFKQVYDVWYKAGREESLQNDAPDDGRGTSS